METTITQDAINEQELFRLKEEFEANKRPRRNTRKYEMRGKYIGRYAHLKKKREAKAKK